MVNSSSGKIGVGDSSDCEGDRSGSVCEQAQYATDADNGAYSEGTADAAVAIEATPPDQQGRADRGNNMPAAEEPPRDGPPPTEKTPATQPRRLLCLYCDRSFASVTLRQKHVERGHSSKHHRRVSSRRHNQLTATACFYCDTLDSAEHTLADLFRHLVSKHAGKYFGCLPCKERFLSSALLADHNAIVHPDTNGKPNTPPPLVIPQKIEELVQDAPSEDEVSPAKVTRSKAKPKTEDPLTIDDDGKPKKLLKNRKMTVKSSKITVKRSKRLQAQVVKDTDPQKKRKSRLTDKKTPTTVKVEATNSTKSSEKSKQNSSCVNPYPEFDSFYRVKKITDHSIDNLKISSLTFDDVFDKAFFNRIRCNIEENLLHHIDGKLFKNEESESRISNFEKISTSVADMQNSNLENLGCEMSLNAVAPISSLSLNSQYDEDFESQVDCGTKPHKKKAQIKKDEVHYKYFTRRKYQASILEHKENRDLSRLDMWTQLVIKERQQKMLDNKKSPKEILEYTSGEEYKNKIRREELNRILDRRGPFEDLKEEATKKAAFDKLNSSSEIDVDEETFSQVRDVLNVILERVFETTDQNHESFDSSISEQPSKTSDDEKEARTIPDYLNLRRKSSVPSDGEVDMSDKITLICSSQETENYELPTNRTRGKNELVELTGEWARCRMYVCAACGAKLADMKHLLEHKSVYHQHVWTQHYEFVGNQSELYRHLSIPALGKVGAVEDNRSHQCRSWKRSDARSCTKCGKQCNALGELHRHVLECGGDWTWMLARKKCKYRPFGAKSRRKRRGLVTRIEHKPKNGSSEKKIYKKTFTGPRQRPSDADTIQRMLANLPPKRRRRNIISPQELSRRRKINSNKAGMKSKQSIEQNSGSKPVNRLMQRNNMAATKKPLRSKVLSSKILDTNSTLMVKRKLAAHNEKRITRNAKLYKTEKSSNGHSDGSNKKVSVKEQNQKKPQSPKPTAVNGESGNENLQPEIKIPVKAKVKERNQTVKNMLTGKVNIKNFFPVKKKKNKDASLETKGLNEKCKKIDAHSIQANSTDTGTIAAKIENEKSAKIGNKGGLKKLVKSLTAKNKKSATLGSDVSNHPSVAKEKISLKKSKNQNIVCHKKNIMVSNRKAITGKEDFKANSKRKLQSSFRTVINKVKKLKIDSSPMNEPKQRTDINNERKIQQPNIFLGKEALERGKSGQPDPIVVPQGVMQNIRSKSLSVPTAINFTDTKENPPIPETIFNLETSNEKSLQAKGELDFDRPDNSALPSVKTKPALVLNSELKNEPENKPKPLPSPTTNSKGKIRKPAKGLNDCIAMLTSKLQQKGAIASCTENILKSSTSVTDEVSNLKASKPECILKIPTFKASQPKAEETALDLSKKTTNVSETLMKSISTPNISAVTPTNNFMLFNPNVHSTSMIDRVIEDVIENKCMEILNERLSLRRSSVDNFIHCNSSKPIRKHNSVDEIIDYVVKYFQPNMPSKLEICDKIKLDKIKPAKQANKKNNKEKKVAAKNSTKKLPLTDSNVEEQGNKLSQRNIPTVEEIKVLENKKLEALDSDVKTKPSTSCLVNILNDSRKKLHKPKLSHQHRSKSLSDIDTTVIGNLQANVIIKLKENSKIIETNIDNVLNVTEVPKKPEVTNNLDSNKNSDSQHILTEDEPDLLENKLVTLPKNPQSVSDSEDELPLACLISGDVGKETKKCPTTEEKTDDKLGSSKNQKSNESGLPIDSQNDKFDNKAGDISYKMQIQTRENEQFIADSSLIDDVRSTLDDILEKILKNEHDTFESASIFHTHELGTETTNKILAVEDNVNPKHSESDAAYHEIKTSLSENTDEANICSNVTEEKTSEDNNKQDPLVNDNSDKIPNLSIQAYDKEIDTHTWEGIENISLEDHRELQNIENTESPKLKKQNKFSKIKTKCKKALKVSMKKLTRKNSNNKKVESKTDELSNDIAAVNQTDQVCASTKNPKRTLRSSYTKQISFDLLQTNQDCISNIVEEVSTANENKTNDFVVEVTAKESDCTISSEETSNLNDKTRNINEKYSLPFEEQTPVDSNNDINDSQNTENANGINTSKVRSAKIKANYRIAKNDAKTSLSAIGTIEKKLDSNSEDSKPDEIASPLQNPSPKSKITKSRKKVNSMSDTSLIESSASTNEASGTSLIFDISTHDSTVQNYLEEFVPQSETSNVSESCDTTAEDTAATYKLLRPRLAKTKSKSSLTQKRKENITAATTSMSSSEDNQNIKKNLITEDTVTAVLEVDKKGYLPSQEEDIVLEEKELKSKADVCNIESTDKSDHMTSNDTSPGEYTDIGVNQVNSELSNQIQPRKSSKNYQTKSKRKQRESSKTQLVALESNKDKKNARLEHKVNENVLVGEVKDHLIESPNTVNFEANADVENKNDNSTELKAVEKVEKCFPAAVENSLDITDNTYIADDSQNQIKTNSSISEASCYIVSADKEHTEVVSTTENLKVQASEEKPPYTDSTDTQEKISTTIPLSVSENIVNEKLQLTVLEQKISKGRQNKDKKYSKNLSRKKQDNHKISTNNIHSVFSETKKIKSEYDLSQTSEASEPISPKNLTNESVGKEISDFSQTEVEVIERDRVAKNIKNRSSKHKKGKVKHTGTRLTRRQKVKIVSNAIKNHLDVNEQENQDEIVDTSTVQHSHSVTTKTEEETSTVSLPELIKNKKRIKNSVKLIDKMSLIVETVRRGKKIKKSKTTRAKKYNAITNRNARPKASAKKHKPKYTSEAESSKLDYNHFSMHHENEGKCSFLNNGSIVEQVISLSTVENKTLDEEVNSVRIKTSETSSLQKACDETTNFLDKFETSQENNWNGSEVLNYNEKTRAAKIKAKSLLKMCDVNNTELDSMHTEKTTVHTYKIKEIPEDEGVVQSEMPQEFISSIIEDQQNANMNNFMPNDDASLTLRRSMRSVKNVISSQDIPSVSTVKKLESITPSSSADKNKKESAETFYLKKCNEFSNDDHITKNTENLLETGTEELNKQDETVKDSTLPKLNGFCKVKLKPRPSKKKTTKDRNSKKITLTLRNKSRGRRKKAAKDEASKIISNSNNSQVTVTENCVIHESVKKVTVSLKTDEVSVLNAFSESTEIIDHTIDKSSIIQSENKDANFSDSVVMEEQHAEGDSPKAKEDIIKINVKNSNNDKKKFKKSRKIKTKENHSEVVNIKQTREKEIDTNDKISEQTQPYVVTCDLSENKTIPEHGKSPELLSVDSKEEPIKLVINTHKARRKSKSFKKIVKPEDALFQDFAFVINKKTKRILPTSIIDDSVCEETNDISFMFSDSASENTSVTKTVNTDATPSQDLNDSVEEMDMEIDEIPVYSNIIERDSLNADSSTSDTAKMRSNHATGLSCSETLLDKYEENIQTYKDPEAVLTISDQALTEMPGDDRSTSKDGMNTDKKSTVSDDHNLSTSELPSDPFGRKSSKPKSIHKRKHSNRFKKSVTRRRVLRQRVSTKVSDKEALPNNIGTEIIVHSAPEADIEKDEHLLKEQQQQELSTATMDFSSSLKIAVDDEPEHAFGHSIKKSSDIERSITSVLETVIISSKHILPPIEPLSQIISSSDLDIAPVIDEIDKSLEIDELYDFNEELTEFKKKPSRNRSGYKTTNKPSKQVSEKIKKISITETTLEKLGSYKDTDIIITHNRSAKVKALENIHDEILAELTEEKTNKKNREKDSNKSSKRNEKKKTQLKNNYLNAVEKVLDPTNDVVENIVMSNTLDSSQFDINLDDPTEDKANKTDQEKDTSLSSTRNKKKKTRQKNKELNASVVGPDPTNEIAENIVISNTPDSNQLDVCLPDLTNEKTNKTDRVNNSHASNTRGKKKKKAQSINTYLNVIEKMPDSANGVTKNIVMNKTPDSRQVDIDLTDLTEDKTYNTDRGKDSTATSTRSKKKKKPQPKTAHLSATEKVLHSSTDVTETTVISNTPDSSQLDIGLSELAEDNTPKTDIEKDSGASSTRSKKKKEQSLNMSNTPDSSQLDVGLSELADDKTPKTDIEKDSGASSIRNKKKKEQSLNNYLNVVEKVLDHTNNLPENFMSNTQDSSELDIGLAYVTEDKTNNRYREKDSGASSTRSKKKKSQPKNIYLNEIEKVLDPTNDVAENIIKSDTPDSSQLNVGLVDLTEDDTNKAYREKGIRASNTRNKKKKAQSINNYLNVNEKIPDSASDVTDNIFMSNTPDSNRLEIGLADPTEDKRAKTDQDMDCSASSTRSKKKKSQPNNIYLNTIEKVLDPTIDVAENIISHTPDPSQLNIGLADLTYDKKTSQEKDSSASGRKSKKNKAQQKNNNSNAGDKDSENGVAENIVMSSTLDSNQLDKDLADLTEDTVNNAYQDKESSVSSTRNAKNKTQLKDTDLNPIEKMDVSTVNVPENLDVNDTPDSNQYDAVLAEVTKDKPNKRYRGKNGRSNVRSVKKKTQPQIYDSSSVENAHVFTNNAVENIDENVIDDIPAKLTEDKQNKRNRERDTSRSSKRNENKRIQTKNIDLGPVDKVNHPENCTENVDMDILDLNRLESNMQIVNEENQELRRSRRGSRKIASYNENDLIDPLIDALENTRRSIIKKDKSLDKPLQANENVAQKKLNTDELFDLLKASTTENENINVSCPKAAFLNNHDDSSSSRDFDKFENVFENILEKSSILIQNSMLDKEKDIDKIYEFTDSSPENSKQPKDIDFKHFKSRRSDKNTVISLNSEILGHSLCDSPVTVPGTPDIKDASMESNTAKCDMDSAAKPNFCDICNKSFIRYDNLVKHKRTLTHISKLSEIEAKEAEERAKLLKEENIQSNENDTTKKNINTENVITEEKSTSDSLKESVDTNQPEVTAYTNHESLKLADIINDVLNKPDLENLASEKHNSFSDIIMQNSDNQSEFRPYKSLGERKSFETDEPLIQNPNTPTTFAEKQISLLENIIVNRTASIQNYDDISLSSNNSQTSELNEQDRRTLCSQNSQGNTENFTPEEAFLKPGHYEEISEDSSNIRNFDDLKLRKTLNRDEELFIECCSLLKSGSEVSNYSKKSNKVRIGSNVRLKQFNLPEWLEKKNLIENSCLNMQEYSNNSRTPTPLGDTYDDEASNSNTISSNWNVNTKERHIDDQSVSFAKALHGDLSTAVQQFDNIPSSKSTTDESCTNTKENAEEEDNNMDSKQIVTKGARKVFEGLKVSIPTEELNLEEVFNCSPKNKQEPTEPKDTSENVFEKPSRPGRKSKPVKKEQVGSNLLFKVNKKKITPKTDQEKSEKDVYDFEETQDNADVFTKPNYRTFRNQKTEDTMCIESDSENDLQTESSDTGAHLTLNTSDVADNSTKKKNQQENITKKKCMIMGRIFKNQAKNKVDEVDEEIRAIPEIDNAELVENYVLNCSRQAPNNIPEDEKKAHLSEEELDKMFDELLEGNVKKEEKDVSSKNNSRPKAEAKVVEKKRIKNKHNRKRTRGNSESSDDEFNLTKSSKKRSNRKNNKEQDNCINLEQELRECIGVASRKSQRKCTSGKQNILVEYWSSDEEAFEALLESQKILPQNNNSVEDKLMEKIMESCAKQKTKENNVSDLPNPQGQKKQSIQEKPQLKKKQNAGKRQKVNRSTKAPNENTVLPSNRRKRAAANPLYHWSSSSEDESENLIEVKPVREELEYDEDRPVQHGWIVGDSPKKLVTMLALTKGKKTDIECVKEQNKRRTSSGS